MNAYIFVWLVTVGSVKKVKKYECSQTSLNNTGKIYYVCEDRYTNKTCSCNFFVLAKELEHNIYVTCHCSKLCKKVQWNLNSSGDTSTFRFVCINRSNKSHPGCGFVENVWPVHNEEPNWNAEDIVRRREKWKSSLV